MRHGRTEWNASKKFQGHSDIPLSDEGRAQARALAAVLRGERFDRAFASDLGRAIETAQTILSGSNLEVTIDARLREFDFGLWEGLTWDEIVARWPRYGEAGWADAKGYQPEGGESFAAVEARVGAFLSELAQESFERVLVATHAGVLHAALAVLGPRLSTDHRSMKIVFSPASITRITMEGEQARLITVNDVSHLDTTP